MSRSLLVKVWEAFRQAIGRVLRATVIGLVVGFVLVEGLATALNATAGSPAGLVLGWPPAVSFAPNTAFVHITAVAFALLLGYVSGFSVAVTQTIHGLVYAAEHVDDAIGAVANEGLNMADAVVDAVDGPDRHGFLGRRGPAASSQKVGTRS
jgi:ABC-type sugar transport system permease subunit